MKFLLLFLIVCSSSAAPTGSTGATGRRGARGFTGATGSTGATGRRGALGFTGATGATPSLDVSPPAPGADNPIVYSISSDQYAANWTLSQYNVASGQSTVIGPFGFSAFGNIFISPGGVIYGTLTTPGHLFMVPNISTGAAVIQCNYSSNMQLTGGSFRADGRMYGTDSKNGALILIDPVACTFTTLASGIYSNYAPASVIVGQYMYIYTNDAGNPLYRILLDAPYNSTKIGYLYLPHKAGIGATMFNLCWNGTTATHIYYQDLGPKVLRVDLETATLYPSLIDAQGLINHRAYGWTMTSQCFPSEPTGYYNMHFDSIINASSISVGAIISPNLLIYGHLTTTSPTLPLISVQPTAGTGATAVVAVLSTDCRMKVSLTTGTSGTAPGVIYTVSYTTRVVASAVVFSPANAAAVAAPVYLNTEDSSGFRIASNAALLPNTVYIWNIHACA